MNRVHRVLLISAALVLASQACGVEDDKTDDAQSVGDEAVPDVGGAPLRAVNTAMTVLAEASLSEDHWLAVYELPEGGLGVFETGAEGEASLLDGWNNQGSLVDYLREKAPEAIVTDRADQAERAGLTRTPLTTDIRDVSPELLQRIRALDAVGDAPVLQTLGGPIDPILDAVEWSNFVCGAPEDLWGNAFSWYDAIDCRTNVSAGSTTITSTPTVNYEAKVKNAASTGPNLAVLVQEMKGAEAINLGTWDLRPRNWGKALFRANAKYRITATGPLHHVSVRTRRQMPDARELNDYPFDAADMDNDINVDTQGVAHDDSHWYFTNELRISKFPVGADLNGGSIATALIPLELFLEGFDHLGDLVYANGLLYVPIEATSGANIRGIAVFDLDLNYIGRALINQQHAAWLAYNPQDGHFYTSPDYALVTSLRKYDVQVSGSTVTATALGDIPLQMPMLFLNEVQGGEFSEKGNLYITSNSSATGGVFMVDVLTGFVAKRATLHFDDSWEIDEELEGLTVWDLDDGSAPGIAGQIHVLMVDNDASDDELFFKHMRVNPLGDL